MTVPQIAAHVARHTHERFRAYSEMLGLKDSEVAKLLILSELKARRLTLPEAKVGMPPPVRHARSGAAKQCKITAHMTSVVEVQRFHAHARRCGLTRSSAASLLMRKELEERWLQRCLSRERD
jgi:hypothetical protein